MKAKPEPKPKPLNKCADELGRYKIIEEPAPGKGPQEREVEAAEICYDVIGLRLDGKHVILDHIPTGWRIGRFRSTAKARAAIREMMQVTNFRWIQPPPEIKPAVSAILKRYLA